jgi:hypothetical protein
MHRSEGWSLSCIGLRDGVYHAWLCISRKGMKDDISRSKNKQTTETQSQDVLKPKTTRSKKWGSTRIETSAPTRLV